jgi:hypothetical protein
MTRFFNDFVKGAPEAQPVLPLAHTFQAIDFHSIAEAGELRTAECPIFTGEFLLYFFYGRPAYRAGQGGVKLPEAPISLLIDAKHLTAVHRVAPFDPGAFHKRMYERHFHPRMTKEEFLVDPALEMASRIVGGFYDSNDRYYRCRPLETLTIPAWDFHSTSYLQLIRDRHPGPPDDRRVTIEVQTNHTVPLGPGIVMAVVLPGALLDGPFQRTIQDEWKAFPITYDYYPGGTFTEVIIEKVKDYLTSEGYF